MDEAFFHLSRPDEPDSIQVEVRAPGRLDAQRLASAVAHALRLHPMARARQAPWSPLRLQYTWEITDTLGIEPLAIVECQDDEALASVRERLQGLFVPLEESPPLRMLLVRHPAGDLVMLHASHTATDGIGALRLLRSVLRAYAGAPDVLPAVDPLAVRQLRPLLAARGPQEQRARWDALMRSQAEAWTAPPARIAGHGARAAPGYGFVHARLSAEELARLEGRRQLGATVNDVLLAALHLTIDRWNQSHGQRPHRISTYVPTNLRPAHWRLEVVANLSLSATVSSFPEERSEPRALLASLVRQTRRIKETGEAAALAELLGPAPLVPLFWKQALPGMMALTGERFLPTSVLSNLGELREPFSFGTDAEATELWWSPPARMPMGLAVGVVSQRGTLHLVARHRHTLMDTRAAHAFSQELVRSVLFDFQDPQR
ncbi:MAG TPA: condensation domain-containing protein [Archangium sp.]|nr:condensation domain-containing protein [Archangium sp.]